MNVTIVTPPDTEPITLAEAKLFLRIDGTDEDSLINDAIVSARETVEKESSRQLLTATLETALDRFPASGGLIGRELRHRSGFFGGSRHGRQHDDYAIRVPRPPLQSVASIKYIDANGVQQTLDPTLYQVDARSEPGRILPAYGKSWPTAREQPNAVIVQFVAGWTTGTLPKRVKQLVKLLTQHYYEHRDDDMAPPKAIQRLMRKLDFGEYR